MATASIGFRDIFEQQMSGGEGAEMYLEEQMKERGTGKTFWVLSADTWSLRLPLTGMTSGPRITQSPCLLVVLKVVLHYSAPSL